MDNINLPPSEDTTDAELKTFFDDFYKQQITFPSNQIDAVVGFFERKGFDKVAARSTAIVMLTQAKIENVSPFKLIDSLKKLNDVQLSQVVTQILNSYRVKTSALGYKIINDDETTESRNIKV